MHLSQDKFGEQMNDSTRSSYANTHIPDSLDAISRLEHNHPKYCSKAVKAVMDNDFMEFLQQELKKIYNEFDTNIDNFQAQIVALLAARKDSSSNNISKYYKQSIYSNIDQFVDDLFSKVKSCTMADKQSEDDFYQNVLKGATFNIEPIHNSQVQNNAQLTHLPFPNPTPPIQSALPNDINLQQSPVQDDSFPTQLVLPNDINLQQSPVQDNASPNQLVLSNDINLQQSPVQDNALPTQSVLPNDINLEQSPVQDDSLPTQSVLSNDINLQQSPVQDDSLPVQPKNLDSTQPAISKHFNRLHRNAQSISSSDIQIIKTFIKDFSEIIMNCLLRDPTTVPTKISFLDTLENTLNIWDCKTTLISNESIKVDLLALCEVLKQYYDLFDLRFTQTLENNDFIYFCKDTEENREYFEHVVFPESLKLRQKISDLWTNILKNYKPIFDLLF